MKTFVKQIQYIISPCLKKLGIEETHNQIQFSDRLDLGQFQYNGALAAASKFKSPPKTIAKKIAEMLQQDTRLIKVNVAGPGFVNFSLSPEYLTDRMAVINEDPQLACSDLIVRKKYFIDFGGLNVAKAMHVGHLRSLILGDCLQRISRFLGNETISDIHLGDWGLPMGTLISELKRTKSDLPYFNIDPSENYPEKSPVTLDDLQELYPKASARCKEDEDALINARSATRELQSGREGYIKLWEHFVSVTHNSLKDEFAKLDINFDLWEGESTVNDEVYKLVDWLKSEKIAVHSEGAWIINLEKDKDKKKFPPLLLLKSDGGMLYGTTDLATIKSRLERFNSNYILYVVDQRQHLHFEQVFRAANVIGLKGKTKFEHIGFGTINGLDGKPFKTRAGGTMRLNDLIESSINESIKRLDEAKLASDFGPKERVEIAHAVGIASIKFADLMNHRLSDYIFDINRFTKFEGKTGPYVMYAAVRIKSLLKKAENRGFASSKILVPNLEIETSLMFELSLFSDFLVKSFKTRAPHYLCEYVYSLAKIFNRFYHECPVLKEPDIKKRGSYLSLIVVTLSTIEKSLNLLGISVPNRM